MTASAHDMHAERAVLNAAIAGDAWGELRETVRADHFAHDAHRKIWAAVAAVGLSGAPLDPAAVSAHLKTAGAPGAAQDALAAATADLPSRKHAEAHARRVRDLWAMRNVLQTIGDLAADAARGVDDVAAWLDNAERVLVQATDGRADTSALRPLGDAVQTAYESLVARSESTSRLEGLASGVTDLDAILSGWSAGRLYVIAGRPGSGKTALSKDIVLGIARETGRTCPVFSLEVPDEEWASRAIVGEAGVEYKAWRQAKLDQRAWASIGPASDALCSLPVWIDESPRVSFEYISRACRRLRSQHGNLGAVVVDHMLLMAPSDKRASREQQVAHISAGFKGLAKELSCPVIALTQLNRECEKRQDKRPMLSDLRESGAIEQDADAVIFTYRDEVYNPGTPEPRVMECIVGKQRAGATGTVKLRWDGDRMRTQRLEQHHGAPPVDDEDWMHR